MSQRQPTKATMSTWRHKSTILFLLIFLLSAVLRLGLVVYNRQANDPHLPVIQQILKTNRLPEKADCWECFQPKLFHYSVAQVLQAAGLANAGDSQMALVAEVVNYVAGLLTLLVIGVFIARRPGQSELLKVLAFGLVALNPSLIGINSQATNDSFAILFSTLALYWAFEFMQNQKVLDFLAMVLFAVLGISAKTNVWVTAISMFLALMIKAWTIRQGWSRSALKAGLFACAVFIISIANPLNQYVSNIVGYGSPFLLNIDAQPLPLVFEQTPLLPPGKPGILSIQDGFFTFKFVDLLRTPRVESGAVYPAHRTSLWTQLYGRAHSIHFDNWPHAWSTVGEQGFMLSRGIFGLALLPTALLLAGAAMETISVLKAILRRDARMGRESQFGLAAVTFAGFLLFMCLYALEYRDYQVMKAIFIYPALITFPLLFLKAGERIFARAATQVRAVRAVFGVWLVALLALYSADIATMIRLLHSRPLGPLG